MDRRFLSAARRLTHKHERIPAALEGALALHSGQECKEGETEREREREGGDGERETGTFPRILEKKKKGGREEADSGSDGRQEQIQEEGKWMGCLVYGLDSVSHSGNDPVITERCVKKKGARTA